MKNSIILLFSLCTFFWSNAQETKTLTLPEAVEMTLKNNHVLQLNEAKIREAKANTQEALDRKLPDANISGSYMYLPFNPTTNIKLGSGNFPSPKVRQAIYGSLNASLPIFAGGKINYGIEASKFLEEAARLDAETDRSAVIINTINACVNLFKAFQAIDVVKENIKQSEQRVKDFSNLEKNGILARNDLLKAQLQLSNMNLSLLDAESNYQLACINMNIMMGLNENTILIPKKDGLQLPTIIKTIDEYENLAKKNRFELGAIETRKKVAVVGIKSAKADGYPSIALTGGYIAADVPNVLSVYNALNFGVGVKYNIASLWKKEAKVNQAVAKLNEVESNELIIADKIKLQINQAYQTYLVSTKKIEVFNQSVEQAAENYRITKNKFENGLSTTTELLDADVALFQTKLSVTNAKADSYLAYNNLLNAAGLLNEIKK